MQIIHHQNVRSHISIFIKQFDEKKILLQLKNLLSNITSTCCTFTFRQRLDVYQSRPKSSSIEHINQKLKQYFMKSLTFFVQSILLCWRNLTKTLFTIKPCDSINIHIKYTISNLSLQNINNSPRKLFFSESTVNKTHLIFCYESYIDRTFPILIIGSIERCSYKFNISIVWKMQEIDTKRNLY